MAVRININSLTFGYRRTAPLFEGLTVSVIPSAPIPGRGFVTVVMGSSGCGKTTLLKLLLGEETPFQGGFSIEPADFRVSYLSQDPVLFEHLSVMDNARYFSKLHSTRSQFDEVVFSRASRELGLSAVLQSSSSVMDLSGGERQRVALLRALSIRPSLLLLDEPCRGLDTPVRQEFLFYLRRLTDEFGLAVVYLTHQQSEARLLANRILFLIRSASTGVAKVVEGTLNEFILRPRHESIALTFSEGPVNRVAAELSGSQLVLFGKRYTFQNSQDLSNSGKVNGTLLFRASQVKWNSPGGIECFRAGETGQFLLAAVKNGTNGNDMIIGPHTQVEVSSFNVCGEVFVFDMNGALSSVGMISSDQEAIDTIQLQS